MMKKILTKILVLLAFLGISIDNAQAQYVTIPDANFVNWLTTNYPSCMNGNQMDTTCSALLSTTTLSFLGFNDYFDDFTGLQYFDNILYLEITGYANPIIPGFPPNLTNLTCSFNQLTSLPPLPNSITTLDCQNNGLINLPALPTQLTNLFCNNNQLTSLPILPFTLWELNCNDNLLISLPELPILLEILNCFNNAITCFPDFPSNITSIGISNNPFTCLPNHIPAMDAATLAMPLCATDNINGCAVSSACSSCIIIPDPQFVTFLQQNNTGCMFDNMLDTLCTSVINDTSMHTSNHNISSLVGIEYFHNLKSLFCSNNNLITLPDLPTQLNRLDCYNNQLTSLPTLPLNLTHLDCNNNSLQVLPALPTTLKALNCHTNLLSNLPLLPNLISNISCSQNQLSNLPTLPNALKVLHCEENYLLNLPTLPNNLTILACSNNQLSSLPSLPDSLNNLVCDRNLLTSLPSLPNAVHFLNCAQNQISVLPTLPNNLFQLTCNKNLLSYLPALPNTMTALQCDSNNIACANNFPNNIFYLTISGNPINCLPNYIAAMDAATLAMPLCSAGNTNGCANANGIMGSIYTDSNTNCNMESFESKINNIQVKFFNPITNVFGSTYSASSGLYNYVTSPGTNFVLVDTINKPYHAICTYPGIDSTVVTDIANPLAQNVNFDIACKNGVDLNVQSTSHIGLVFPGQTHTLQVITGDASQWYGLNCSAGTSGQVTITVDGPVTYAGVPSGAITPSIAGNVYTYTISDFGSIDNTKAFQLLLSTDISAQSGNTICVDVNITSSSTDLDTTNNNSYFCYHVLNSYDPNYKEVYPTDVAPLYHDWLTYTIHFQNLGTAPAINIRLLDTLDSNLDAETFEVINYSHYNTITLMNGILDFKFPNIMLPDSASNPAGSQGFVQYRIKPKANLPLGTQIENTAHIYFDFNPAVVTNTTVNNFTNTVGNTSISENKKLSVYPNPSAGIFSLSASANIEVYNLIGDVILTENNAISIDLTAAPKGMYFVKLNGGKIEKLIKN